MVSTHGPVPEQSPPQPRKVEPGLAVAPSTTVDRYANGSLQSLPQLIPIGVDVTRPLPLPVLLTATGRGSRSKVAVTDRPLSMVTGQVVLVPEQSPPQATKRESAAGLAVRLTSVPGEYCAEQVAPQSMPAGLETTLPTPSPSSTTTSSPSAASGGGGGGASGAPGIASGWSGGAASGSSGIASGSSKPTLQALSRPMAIRRASFRIVVPLSCQEY